MKKYSLGIIVFLSGAIGMGLELIASRILSPYVGSSNVVWTSIIGIILVSMSLGYWIGGKFADKKTDFKIIEKIIWVSAIFTCIIPLLETYVVKVLADIFDDHLITAAILCSLIVFSIPSFFLAMISPYAVKLSVKDNSEVGTISGRISSISTIGSIVGTFVMGFVLIPNLGVNNIIIGTVVILIVMAILMQEKINKKQILKSILYTIIMVIIILLGKIVFKLENPDILVDTDSQYSRIWVKQIAVEDKLYKTLQVDTGLESYIDAETGEMGARYLRYYDLYEYFVEDAKDVLLIGGAAYTYPMHYLDKYEENTIDVVEIDSKMTQVAVEEFGLDLTNNRLNIYEQDGRSFLNYSNNKYDAILIDAFKGVDAPFELTTYEALNNAKDLLNENGVVITNIISSVTGEDAEFIEYEYTTYKAVFDDVKVYKVSNVEDSQRQNLILVGIKGELNIDSEKYEEYKEYLNKEITNVNTTERIVTDNYAPIGN